METIILSRILGIVLFVLALGVFVNFKKFMRMVEEVGHDSSLLLFSSLLRLIVGSIVVVFHTVWSSAIGIIITLLGRLILLAGVG